MRVTHWLFTICLFTASFDIFLVFQLGGTVRFAQLVMVAVVHRCFSEGGTTGPDRVASGRSLVVVMVWVQVLFLPASIDYGFSVRYLMFLFFTVGCFFSVVELYGDSRYLSWLMKAYLCRMFLLQHLGCYRCLALSSIPRASL